MRVSCVSLGISSCFEGADRQAWTAFDTLSHGHRALMSLFLFALEAALRVGTGIGTSASVVDGKTQRCIDNAKSIRLLGICIRFRDVSFVCLFLTKADQLRHFDAIEKVLVGTIEQDTRLCLDISLSRSSYVAAI